MADLEAFFGLIAQSVTPELDRDSAQDLRHWVLLQDATGTEMSPLDTDRMPVHELLASLIANGAEAAAYVTHRAEAPECVVAQALLGSPPTSDTRRASVVRRLGASTTLGRWEGPIS